MTSKNSEMKVWKGPYYIGTQKFNTMKQCEQFVRDKIGNNPRKIERDDEQFQFFKQLLRNHSEYKTKRGEGIQCFEFITNPMNKKAMHGIVNRTDGTSVDYSWLHCCRNANTKLSDNALTSAMRNTISKDTIAFKRNQYQLTCQQCQNNSLSYSEYHVDHKSPPFRDIKTEFLQLHNNIPSQFNRCPTTKVSIFNEQDKQFENDWYEFHKNKATYQMLCQPCNSKKH